MRYFYQTWIRFQCKFFFVYRRKDSKIHSNRLSTYFHPTNWIFQLSQTFLWIYTVFDGSAICNVPWSNLTLWKMCADLDLLVIKIRQYYDKPPTISHIFILQWAQNIYDVEFGFLWYFRKTFWFNACNGRDFETNISSNCMSFLIKFRKNSATLYTQFSLVDVTALPHRKFYF